MLGIDDRWAYTMTDADLADVQMEGFESLQSRQTAQVYDDDDDDDMGSHIDIDDDCIEPINTEPVVNRRQEQVKEERRE